MSPYVYKLCSCPLHGVLPECTLMLFCELYNIFCPTIMCTAFCQLLISAISEAVTEVIFSMLYWRKKVFENSYVLTMIAHAGATFITLADTPKIKLANKSVFAC